MTASACALCLSIFLEIVQKGYPKVDKIKQSISHNVVRLCQTQDTTTIKFVPPLQISPQVCTPLSKHKHANNNELYG